MRALMMKELQLVMHPSTPIMILLGTLTLIPRWPYAIIVLYGILTAFFNALNAREAHDESFTFALPVSRRDMVRVRVGMMCAIETVMVIIMAVCICVRPALGIDAIAEEQPMVGMPANIALIGLFLASFGLFNVVFFPLYHKDPTKVGIPFLVACICACAFGGAFEAIPFMPFEACQQMSASGTAHLDVQCIVLCAGLVAFAALSALATLLARRAFATYDA